MKKYVQYLQYNTVQYYKVQHSQLRYEKHSISCVVRWGCGEKTPYPLMARCVRISAIRTLLFYTLIILSSVISAIFASSN